MEKILSFFTDECVFDPFAPFQIVLDGVKLATPEHGYHFLKFAGRSFVQNLIVKASSPFEAKEIAEKYKHLRQKDWKKSKIPTMKKVLRAVVDQHEYVRKKLLSTHGKRIVHNSPYDSFWGNGPDDNGSDHIGKIWMEIRDELEKECDDWAKYLPV